jgi:transposase InsO family protein
MRQLNEKKIRWIIRWSLKGKSTRYLSTAQKVTQRRVQQLLKTYGENGNIVLKAPGRKRNVIPVEQIRLILSEHPRNSGAVILEKRIGAKHKIHIPHNTIHMVLKHAGCAKDEPKKQKRRKWVRYEREHSLSLVHTDWHESKAVPGKHVIAYLDDASRFVLACDEYDRQSSENAINTLRKAMSYAEQYGGIKAVLTDHGSEFYANKLDRRGKSSSGFQSFLKKHGIKHIVARVKHPQTNGKIERWYQTYNRKRAGFRSLDEFLDWYNRDRAHMSLKLHYAETPAEAFLRKMDPIIWVGQVKEWFE